MASMKLMKFFSMLFMPSLVNGLDFGFRFNEADAVAPAR